VDLHDLANSLRINFCLNGEHECFSTYARWPWHIGTSASETDGKSLQLVSPRQNLD
jgi:hypothetical protein